MPSNWQYHADGVKTAFRTVHDLDGTLRTVILQLDSFRHRSWEEEEAEAAGRNLKHLTYDEETGTYEEYADGSHAALTFGVDGGHATLSKIEPKDDEYVAPRHMMLFPAAERILAHLDGVDEVESSLETLASRYHDAGEIYIERLDG